MPHSSINRSRSSCKSSSRAFSSPQMRSGKKPRESSSVSGIAKCSSSPILPHITAPAPSPSGAYQDADGTNKQGRRNVSIDRRQRPADGFERLALGSNAVEGGDDGGDDHQHRAE